MVRSWVLALILILPIFGSEAYGQEFKNPASAKKGPLGEFEVQYVNGSSIRVFLKSTTFEIDTRFGLLKVPLQEVRAIEFGLHYPEGVVAKITQAIEDLGKSDFTIREKAAKYLLEVGPFAYPMLTAALESSELEVARRAKDLVKTVQKKYSKKDLKANPEDKVVTTSFTIFGKIQAKNVNTESENFGPLTVSLDRLRSVRYLGASMSDVEVTIDAAKYANANQWLETNFQTNGRAAISITAKGSIDTWPQGAGQYMTGPNGVGGQMLGAALAFGGNRNRNKNAQISPQNGGALFGKIGEDGEPFLIGDSYEGTPEQDGKLYLHIAPSPWNCESMGSYEVKISRK